MTVPSALSPGEYTIKVYKNGLLATAAGTFRFLGPGPFINSFSPATDDVGGRVILRGSGFGATAGENTVTFLQGSTAVEVVITEAASYSLEVAVPSTLTAGSYQIQVTTNGQTFKTSTVFTATVTDTEPIVTGISANPISRGQVLTLTGRNFKSSGRITYLLFRPIGGGVSQLRSPTSSSVDGTQMTFTIPDDFPLGQYVVSVSKPDLYVVGEAPAPYHGTAPGKLTVH